MKIMLDTGPLTMLLDPNKHPDVKEWFKEILKENIEIYIPEIADYETRRWLIYKRREDAIKRLDRYKNSLCFVPIKPETMLQAAKFWAESKWKGKPTADDKELNGDVILAAQAKQVGAIIATENVGHLSQLVNTKHWKEIKSQPEQKIP